MRLCCSHGWYCEYCMRKHADARLAVGDVLVPCPECREPVQESSLKQFLRDDVVARFHARSIQKAIASSSNLFTCPTANCDMCVELEEGEEAWLKKCPMCKKGSCLRCGAQPYHKGISCQMHALRSRTTETKGADIKLRNWMRKTGTKQCPGCKMGVSKDDLKNQNSQKAECHKMLCRNCGVKFCYKCLAFLSNAYTCGCSMDRHGFFNPVTKKMVTHLRTSPKKASSAAANKAARSKASAAKKKSVRSKASAAKGSARRSVAKRLTRR